MMVRDFRIIGTDNNLSADSISDKNRKVDWNHPTPAIVLPVVVSMLIAAFLRFDRLEEKRERCEIESAADLIADPAG